MSCPGANPGDTTALTPLACKDVAGHSQPVLLQGRTCVMFASANIGVRLVACLHGQSAFAVHIPALMPYSAGNTGPAQQDASGPARRKACSCWHSAAEVRRPAGSKAEALAQARRIVRITILTPCNVP